MAALRNVLRSGQLQAQAPLFILGAGISHGVVPLLADIAEWIQGRLEQGNSNIPDDYKWVRDYSISIAKGLATRREAAEFFTALQGPTRVFRGIWREFSESFLVKGLSVSRAGGPTQFEGLCNVRPTKAHEALADLISKGQGHVVSLNFDGLTRAALQKKTGAGIALHSNPQLESYYAAITEEYIPAVIKVRGDVFYAVCEKSSCPTSYNEYPLDRITPASPESALQCPTCGSDTLRLQFSFPGYRKKEEEAEPMLWTMRRYLASRLSAIIIVGLSGRWDRYLLRFVFDLALERNLLIADVKPTGYSLIEAFRSSYYPSVRKIEDAHDADRPGFVRIETDADALTGHVRDWLQTC